MTICSRLVIFILIAFWTVNSSSQELVKVPVQIPSISPAIGAFAIARDRGYYRQEGLDVQLVLIPSALGMQALLAGNIKFSTARRPSRTQSRAAIGEDFRLFCG